MSGAPETPARPTRWLKTRPEGSGGLWSEQFSAKQTDRYRPHVADSTNRYHKRQVADALIVNTGRECYANWSLCWTYLSVCLTETTMD